LSSGGCLAYRSRSSSFGPRTGNGSSPQMRCSASTRGSLGR
jgi:hypothetical protein